MRASDAVIFAAGGCRANVEQVFMIIFPHALRSFRLWLATPRRQMCARMPAAFGFLALAAPVAAAEEGAAAGHGDPVAPILIALVLISASAIIGGRLIRRFGQPAVLGELLIGVLVANLGYYFHEPYLTVLRDDAAMVQIIEVSLLEHTNISEAARRVLPEGEQERRLLEILDGPLASNAVSIHHFIDIVSRLAVIVLLFLVGLETSVKEMARVGKTASYVAVVGVVVPFVLGTLLTRLLLPGHPMKTAIFLGGILTATSVGITARVFRDLRQEHRKEAKVILGAAVIDDVLGLIVLAVVSGLVVTGAISFWNVAAISVKSALFLAGAIGVGAWITPRLVRRLARLEIENSKVLFGLGLAFFLSWLADSVGLATIVGAFAAGLVLEELFLDELKGHSLRELLSPLEALIVPVFFVLMGMQVKLETFADWRVLLMASALTLAAILGKVVSGWAAGKGMDRLSIGIGMMPRGEVGLIFASIGKGLGVVSDSVFSAVVIMVMVTTLLTPPLLKITLARSEISKA